MIVIFCINIRVIQVASVLRHKDWSLDFVAKFMEWFRINFMTCNPEKCKELTFLKKFGTQMLSIRLLQIYHSVKNC